jgi:predicted O-linked N-acetylglucosamine transferase (SPINDLY family)
LARAGRTDEAIAAMRACLAQHPDAADLRSNMLLMLHYVEADPALVLREHQAFGASMPAPEPPAHAAGEPLRVGVLSSDLNCHAVGSFVEPMFQHPPAGTQVIAFANAAHAHQDPLRLRLQRMAHAWHDVHLLDDAALDALIRREHIDVLVELNGHTADNRLPALARKPAPVIVTAIGYPDTTGLPAVDGRIVDSITDPPGSERWCTERLLRIDPCFLCYTPLADAPDPAMPPEDAPFTFGSFNNAAKIGPATAALWARVMRAVPESRLLLKSTGLVDPAVQQVLQRLCMDAGVPLERVEMVGITPDQRSHLQMYNRVHVALDTTPYNGTTTTCEALWMGVPVVTLLGDRHSARVSASLLHAAGFPEWVATDAEQFARIAAQLAHDREALTSLRVTMRDRLRASTLLDAPAYAARLHAALRGARMRP